MQQEFIKMCRMTQEELKEYMRRLLLHTKGDVISSDGYLYYEGSVPILLVAHLDTVFSNPPKDIIIKDNIISSPQGIGGDDRCGVYIISEIMKTLDCSILLLEDEEIGGEGAVKFFDSNDCIIQSAMRNNAIIEIDRQGFNDAVFYQCTNENFQKIVCKDFYQLRHGTFSDISILAPMLGIAAVNVSAGYYYEHSYEEEVCWNQVLIIKDRVKDLIYRIKDEFYPYSLKN